MLKTFQDLKMKIEAINKVQTEKILEIKNEDKQIKTTNESNGNRIQEI